MEKKQMTIIAAVLAVALLITGVMLYKESSSHKEDNAAMNGYIDALNAEVAEVSAQVEAMNTQLAEKDTTISALTAEKDSQIEALTAEKDGQIEALNAQLSEKDAAIADLTAEKDSQIEALTADLAAKTAELEFVLDKGGSICAVMIGEHSVSNRELNYYFVDVVNNFNSTYGAYAVYFGLDTTKPLNQQVQDSQTGATWADLFLTNAINSVRSTYALCDAAEAAGFTLSEDQQLRIDTMADVLGYYAQMYGYESADAFLQAQYGELATAESYLNYYATNTLASAYQTYYEENISISAEQIAQQDALDPTAYSTYDFQVYTLEVSRFLSNAEDPTEGDQAEALAAAEEAAAALTANGTSAEAFDASIAALGINEGTDAKSVAYTNQSASQISSDIASWVTDSARKAGDVTAVAITETDADGNTAVTAYTVVLFNGENDRRTGMVNVRHILVSTMEDAQAILDAFTADPTIENFAAMAAEKSTDTGSSSNGGLYTDVYPGQMVTPFNDWCFDSSRQAGDTGIVQTDYGFHVMFFEGTTGTTYRDHLISNDILTAEMNAWTEAILAATPAVIQDASHINAGMTLS